MNDCNILLYVVYVLTKQSDLGCTSGTLKKEEYRLSCVGLNPIVTVVKPFISFGTLYVCLYEPLRCFYKSVPVANYYIGGVALTKIEVIQSSRVSVLIRDQKFWWSTHCGGCLGYPSCFSCLLVGCFKPSSICLCLSKVLCGCAWDGIGQKDQSKASVGKPQLSATTPTKKLTFPL